MSDSPYWREKGALRVHLTPVFANDSLTILAASYQP